MLTSPLRPYWRLTEGVRRPKKERWGLREREGGGVLEEGVRKICRQKGRGLIRFKLGIASLAFLTEFVFVWMAEEE